MSSRFVVSFRLVCVGLGVPCTSVCRRGLFRSIARFGRWCLHFALPIFGVCPRLAVGRRSHDDKIMLGFAVWCVAKLVEDCCSGFGLVSFLRGASG